MKELTKDQVKFFNQIKREFRDQNTKYSYNVIRQMNLKPLHFYISTNLTPVALSGVMAYIEHVSFDITHDCCYSMTESEIVEIINKFYTKVIYLEEEPQIDYYEIDLYSNWEYHASYPYELGIPEFHRDGLLEFIKEMSIRNNWLED